MNLQAGPLSYKFVYTSPFTIEIYDICIVNPSEIGVMFTSATATNYGAPGSLKSAEGKLSLAIALIGRSPLLFLDEPSAAVDAGAKRHLWKAGYRHGAELGEVEQWYMLDDLYYDVYLGPLQLWYNMV